MTKKKLPIFLISVVLLMVSLHVSAMEFFPEEKEMKETSAIAAAVREHERNATAPEDTGSEQDNLKATTFSTADPSSTDASAPS